MTVLVEPTGRTSSGRAAIPMEVVTPSFFRHGAFYSRGLVWKMDGAHFRTTLYPEKSLNGPKCALPRTELF